MEVLPPVLLVILVIAAIVAAVIYGIRARAKRREMFAGIAARLDGRFYADDPFGLSRRHQEHFATLASGSNRYAYNVIKGRWEGRPIHIFDHHYETYSHNKNGRQTHHHHRTFVLVEHDVDMGRLEVRPEGMFDKLKAAFGFDDVDFESAEFSKRWHVGAEDRKFAYALFHPRMMEYFLKLRGFKLSTHGPWGLYRVGSGRMNKLQIDRTLKHAKGFLELVPRFVQKDRAL
ncbi:MAG: hypothetical protein ACYTGZ_19710 [Planctomycetota bacterium]|jgi:hypothetical protein